MVRLNGAYSTRSLEIVDRDNEALFQFLWCPVCGHEIFTHIWWSPEPGEDWEPVERSEFDDVDEPEEVSHLA
ncbi:DUF7567 family protein [Halogranum rubrum]|uniref:Uncharacterized protein n=1 Tax=Halogranum salarium B-1 TaxID=1210908 RepID=J3JDI8_9EURY|nr:hypothetical protein [Halogranum salarium]EJN57526.1 hypothetical protein HSB1_42140 [Halogranum salarium B-1]